MNVPLLLSHDVPAMHGKEICKAARRVIDSGWYQHGKDNELFEHYSEYIGPNTASVALLVCMR